ncbi:MAG: exodeoxyribonuclease VII small subunit [Acidimicrobiia bacterium]|nr:exodeoxyribonuclease VII small subunit [Acidimicrobiia bacterium]MDH5238020.1 exodeoxyribonuclease VII small subunit [Acidimicrobiia bacterium]
MTETESGPGYAEALAELDEILSDLEADDIDVDVLATKVERAAELIRLCQGRIATARVQVEKVVAELAGLDPAEPGADDETLFE